MTAPHERGQEPKTEKAEIIGKLSHFLDQGYKIVVASDSVADDDYSLETDELFILSSKHLPSKGELLFVVRGNTDESLMLKVNLRCFVASQGSDPFVILLCKDVEAESSDTSLSVQ